MILSISERNNPGIRQNRKSVEWLKRFRPRNVYPHLRRGTLTGHLYKYTFKRKRLGSAVCFPLQERQLMSSIRNKGIQKETLLQDKCFRCKCFQCVVHESNLPRGSFFSLKTVKNEKKDSTRMFVITEGARLITKRPIFFSTVSLNVLSRRKKNR